MGSRIRGRFPLLLLLPLLAGLPLAAPAGERVAAVPAAESAPATAATAGAAGRVVFAIGSGQILRAGVTLPAGKGAAILAGDAIETPEGGHVHIRFVDGAYVSVRPNSRLTVDAYDYDAAHPERSTVKFSLERGTARSISGRAAQSARERFRLNTPLVAIGVRGTDFVTRVRDNAVAAVVNQGAIVVAPFDDVCKASGLGACNSGRARLLTAEMASVVEYGLHQAAPSLKPALPRTLDTPSLMVPEEVNAPQASNTPNTVQAAASNVRSTTASVYATTPATISASLPSSNALAWGRWTFVQGQATPAPGDTVSEPWIMAATGRMVTVGNLYAGLFRTQSGPVGYPASLGVADFLLLQSGTTFTGSNGLTQAAATNGGSLSINFGTGLFATRLNLLAPATGAVTFQSAGSLNGSGYLTSLAGAPLVAGALSQDAQRVGYMFQLPVTAGRFNGLTLWGR